MIVLIVNTFIRSASKENSIFPWDYLHGDVHENVHAADGEGGRENGAWGLGPGHPRNWPVWLRAESFAVVLLQKGMQKEK